MQAITSKEVENLDETFQRASSGKYYRWRIKAEEICVNAYQEKWLEACTPAYLRDRLKLLGSNVPYETVRLWLIAIKRDLEKHSKK